MDGSIGAGARVAETELVVALVAAIGTDLDMIEEEVTLEFDQYAYKVQPLRLSEYLAEEAGANFRDKKFDERVWDAMTAGDRLRDAWDRSDALALHAISDIAATREQLHSAATDQSRPQRSERHAFVLRSLKTPDELETLRAVYGSRLIVVAAYSPKDKRLAHLAARIATSRGTEDRSRWVHQPDDLIERDQKEERSGGQDVRGTFHRADFFIRGWDRDVAREDIERMMEILFGSPFRTPTRDEHGQFLAAGAALRSAEFGRQVGAAITTPEGSVIAVGTNEVPKASGGSHWEEDGYGNRDFEIREVDTNREQFDALAQQLAVRIDRRIGELADELDESMPDVGLELLRARLREVLPAELRTGGLKDLTEFGRAVHAEMNALLNAASRGVAVGGATLHTTTFPCHNCARHLIGAGIVRVVFIEPYTKSRAEQLHADSATIAQSQVDSRKVAFEPFVGVAPRRYLEFFDAAGREQLGLLGRKDASGHKQEFLKAEAVPVIADAGLPQFRPHPREYQIREVLALSHFFDHVGLASVRDEDEATVQL